MCVCLNYAGWTKVAGRTFGNLLGFTVRTVLRGSFVQSRRFVSYSEKSFGFLHHSAHASHAAHSSHATHSGHAAGGALGLWFFRHDALGGGE